MLLVGNNPPSAAWAVAFRRMGRYLL